MNSSSGCTVSLGCWRCRRVSAVQDGPNVWYHWYQRRMLGLTHGGICAHLGKIYGAEVPEVSKETISQITDRVLEGMSDWQNRPLDPVYPVIFVDAIHVKIRDGPVANRLVYIAIGVTVDGTREILGLWVGDGGERRGGGQVLVSRPDRDQELGHQRRVHPGLRRADRPAQLRHRTVRWPRCGPRPSSKPALCICCVTASATRLARTGGPSPRTSSPHLHRCDRGRRLGPLRLR